MVMKIKLKLMCGIVGVITKQYDEKRFKNACNMQSHRGPDFNAEHSVRLNEHFFVCGHQRLSIIGCLISQSTDDIK